MVRRHRVRRTLLATTALMAGIGAGTLATSAGPAGLVPTAAAAGFPTYTERDTRNDAYSPPDANGGASDPRFDIRTVRATRYSRDIYGLITFADLKPASFVRYQFTLIGTNSKGGTIELRQAAEGPPTVTYYDLRPDDQGAFAATVDPCRGATMTARTSKNKISFDIPRRCFIGQGNRMNVNVRAAKWTQDDWRSGRMRSYPGPGAAKTADVVFDSWKWS